MYALTKLLALTAIASSLLVNYAAEAGTPETRADGVTVIHLDEYNGYFAAEETVASLVAGEYEFIVTNKAGKLVGFQVQNLADKETVAMFPLEPGETKSARLTITTAGVRYRCPINPTPWYELDNIKGE
jgi:hypothetical protein